MQPAKLHYTQEMRYLRAVADYLISCGYDVEEPSTKHRNLLDVWGTVKGKRVFQEIYCTIYPCDNGINGVWDNGDNDCIEIFLDSDGDLQSTECLTVTLEGLKPLRNKG